jgi:HEAT repeat protein
MAASVFAADVAELRKLLESDDATVRTEAARELGRLGSKAEAAVPDLEAALEDPDRQVRRAAAWALERIRKPESAKSASALAAEARELAEKAKPLWTKFVMDYDNLTDLELDELISLFERAIDLYAQSIEIEDNPGCNSALLLLARHSRQAMLGREQRRYAKRQKERESRKPKPPTPTEPEPEPEPEPDPGPSVDDEAKLLLERLRDASGRERLEVAEELGKLGAGAAPRLRDTLGGEDKSVHAGAALALYRTGEGERAALFTLISLLDGGEAKGLRIEAVQALAAIGPAAATAVPGLMASLKDSDATVRAASALALGRVGPAAKRAARLLGDALRDDDAEVRRQASTALGEVGPAASAGVPALLRCLEGDDFEMTRRCVTALGLIGPEAKTIVPAVQKHLRSHDHGVREAAIRAMGLMGSDAKRAVPDLVNVLVVETYDELRKAAADALASIGGDAVPELIKCLKDQRPDSRLFACTILGRIGPDAARAVSALASALSDKTPDVAVAAATALGRIGEDARTAVSPLTAALKHDNWRVRMSAATALGEIGPAARAAVRGLAALLEDADWQVRRAAATALGRMGSAAKSASAALTIAADGDGREEVRKAAAAAVAAVAE